MYVVAVTIRLIFLTGRTAAASLLALVNIGTIAAVVVFELQQVGTLRDVGFCVLYVPAGWGLFITRYRVYIFGEQFFQIFDMFFV